MTIPALLENIIGPPQGHLAPIDWVSVESRIGTALPSDYKELADKYPLLFFDEWFAILHPSTPDPPSNPYNIRDLASRVVKNSISSLFSEAEELITYTPDGSGGDETTEVLAPARAPFDIYPAPGGVLPWGITEENQDCCWLTVGEPDAWTVVVTDEQSWWHYKGSITQFLVDVLSRRVPCPAFPFDFPDPEIDPVVKQIFD